MADPIEIRNKKGSLGVTISDTVNANLQGVAGPAIVGDSNLLRLTTVNNTSITATDQGAIDAAKVVQLKALDSTQHGLDSAIAFANSIGTKSLDFADSSLQRSASLIGQTNSQAFNTVSDAINRAANFAQDATQNALNFAFNATRSESQAIGQDTVKTVQYIGLAVALAWAIRGLK